MMCRVLKLPRSTYYDSFHKKPNSYHIANEVLLDRIKVIHNESKGRYGAPKIHEILQKEGYSCSIKRVQRLMRQAGIQSCIVKKYRPALFLASRKCMKWQLKMHTYTCQIPWLTLRD